MTVHRIELRDCKNRIGPGSGLGKAWLLKWIAHKNVENGVILSVLEPTGSNEEVMRGLAIRGTQTSSHIYYEHIEVRTIVLNNDMRILRRGVGAPIWIEHQRSHRYGNCWILLPCIR